MVDFESQLQACDLEMLDQEGDMVYMSPEVVGLMKHFSSDVQVVKDLSEHVKMGYSVGPIKQICAAIEYAIKSLDAKSNNYSVLKQYHQALLNGDALIRNSDMSDRRDNKCEKFCTLFVRGCANVGSLAVRNGLTIGSVGFNTSVTSLNIQGAFESSMGIVRGTYL